MDGELSIELLEVLGRAIFALGKISRHERHPLRNVGSSIRVSSRKVKNFAGLRTTFLTSTPAGEPCLFRKQNMAVTPSRTGTNAGRTLRSPCTAMLPSLLADTRPPLTLQQLRRNLRA